MREESVTDYQQAERVGRCEVCDWSSSSLPGRDDDAVNSRVHTIEYCRNPFRLSTRATSLSTIPIKSSWKVLGAWFDSRLVNTDRLVLRENIL